MRESLADQSRARRPPEERQDSHICIGKYGELLPADILFEAITCKSLTSIKTRIRKALAKQKAENN